MLPPLTLAKSELDQSYSKKRAALHPIGPLSPSAISVNSVLKNIRLQHSSICSRRFAVSFSCLLAHKAPFSPFPASASLITFINFRQQKGTRHETSRAHNACCNAVFQRLGPREIH